MTINRISIENYGTYWKCKATVISKNWKYCNNIEYYSDLARWASDYYSLSDSVKKMCRREWYKKAKEAGLSRKVLNVMI